MDTQAFQRLLIQLNTLPPSKKSCYDRRCSASQGAMPSPNPYPTSPPAPTAPRQPRN